MPSGAWKTADGKLLVEIMTIRMSLRSEFFGYIDEERKLRLSQSQKRTRDCSTVSASKS